MALLAVVAAWEGFVRGPRSLEVTHHRVETEKVTAPLRILVLADIQTDAPGERERQVLARALDERPDLILLPGDYVQTSRAAYAERLADLRAIFDEIGLAAPLGVFAVEGNVDRKGWTALFEGLEGRAFDQSGTVDTGPLRITGLSFHDSFRAHLSVPAAGLGADRERALASGNAPFHVVFGHGPDFALGAIDADLLLAGHTHGGQVRVPWFGPPMTLSKVPRAWAAGRTALEGERTLIVSRGIGMERGGAPRVRFLCPPEIVVVDLVPR